MTTTFDGSKDGGVDSLGGGSSQPVASWIRLFQIGSNQNPRHHGRGKRRTTEINNICHTVLICLRTHRSRHSLCYIHIKSKGIYLITVLYNSGKEGRREFYGFGFDGLV